ncbi:MAG: acyl--CoA ligase [Akkermansiaceae bacterium]|nr:acyl--CoA ligase [Akkermansiaceae bacterium]
MIIVDEIKGRAHGSRVAIREGGNDISFDALFHAVAQVRNQLLAHPAFHQSVVPRIGVRFPNGLGYIVVALAVLETKACFVPIPDELTGCEREQLIGETALHGVVSWVESGNPDSVIDLPLGLGRAEVRGCQNPTCGFSEQAFDALNPAFIRFSSGTTAASKGVILSHESLLARIRSANDALGIQPGDCVLWTLPMAHHFAVSIVLYLYFGATTVIEACHQPDQIYQSAKNAGANILYGSPFHFAQLAQCGEAGYLPSLRLAVSTASALSDGVAEAFEKRFQLPLTQALGIIEVGLPILNLEHAKDMPTALGQVLPAYEWKIRDYEQDKGVGELLLRGPGMFDAYLSPWQTRAEISDDDWFATGDLVEEVLPGTLMMRGRCKSVINVGGMKVFPEEIEAAFNEHPSILRSRVFAARHPTLGGFPVGEFICKEGCSVPSMLELIKFCEPRLAAYKIPLQMKAVDHIDLTPSGKVKRH